MSLSFVIPEFNIGGAGTPPLQFFRRGFILNGTGGSQPSWKDVILKGVTALTLVNAKANGLNYLKLFGGCTQTALPQGYTQLDSITLDGACYFNTGIVIDSLISKVTLIASFATQTDSSPCMMWGFMDSSTSNLLPRWGVGLYSSKWLTSANATTPYGTNDTSRHTFFTELYDSSGTPFWRSAVDGTALGGGVISSSSTFGDNTLSVYIGARNNNETAGNFAKGDFTYLEIEQDGVLYGKIYPCKRNSDNTLGIYNTVTNEFITKSGSGTVTAGNTTLVPSPNNAIDIVCNNGTIKTKDSELPYGYRRVKGFSMNDDCYFQITNFKMKGSDTLRFSFTRTGTSSCNVLGAYDGTSATTNYSLYAGNAGGSQYLRYDGLVKNSYAVADKRYNVVITPTGTTGMQNNSTWTEETFTSTTDLCIGTTSPSATSLKMIGSIHGNVQVDGRLKCIPCESPDGVFGYYDTYSQTFYEPATGTPTSLGYDDYTAEVFVDGTVETVNVHGKNLFDIATATTIYRNGAVLETKTATGYTLTNSSSASNFILVNFGTVEELEGKTFVMSTTNTVANSYGFLYANADGTNRLGAVVTNPITVSSENAQGRTNVVLKIFANIADSSVIFTYNDVQVEEGSTATPYGPYFNGGSATAEMLLKVGDYQDEQSVLDGVVTRNVGIKVLDGTEDWTYTSDCFQIFIDSKSVGAPIPISTHFISATGTGTNRIPDKGIGCSNSNTRTWLRYDIYQGDVTQFKQFLADQYANGTPVIIVYPLATPTTETVTGQPLTIQAGTNVVEITQASIDNLELEVSYKAGVTVTVTEIENAQLDNSVEVTVNG